MGPLVTLARRAHMSDMLFCVSLQVTRGSNTPKELWPDTAALQKYLHARSQRQACRDPNLQKEFLGALNGCVNTLPESQTGAKQSYSIVLYVKIRDKACPRGSKD